MKFNSFYNRQFNSGRGAYSIVTHREYYDSQVTLTDFEFTLVTEFFKKHGVEILVGKVGLDPELAKKTFRSYPSGEEIGLNLVFPKADKPELRLYLSSRAGFKPAAGEVMFVFERADEIWIGGMPQEEWHLKRLEIRKDEDDQEYQHIIQSPVLPVARESKVTSFSRSRTVAVERMKQSDFRCEFDNSHKLFLAKSSGWRYTEVHHIIPIMMQGEFDVSIDVVTNLVCLCPFCHRAIHHAEDSLSREILEKVSEENDILNRFRLEASRLESFYGIESID